MNTTNLIIALFAIILVVGLIVFFVLATKEKQTKQQGGLDDLLYTLGLLTKPK